MADDKIKIRKTETKKPVEAPVIEVPTDEEPTAPAMPPRAARDPRCVAQGRHTPNCDCGDRSPM